MSPGGKRTLYIVLGSLMLVVAIGALMWRRSVGLAMVAFAASMAFFILASTATDATEGFRGGGGRGRGGGGRGWGGRGRWGWRGGWGGGGYYPMVVYPQYGYYDPAWYNSAYDLYQPTICRQNCTDKYMRCTAAYAAKPAPAAYGPKEIDDCLAQYNECSLAC